MPRPTADAPLPAVRSPTFTPAVMSLTLPIVCRTSGSVSFISSLVVSSSSCTEPRVPRSRIKTAARASATMSAEAPNAAHIRFCSADTPLDELTNAILSARLAVGRRRGRFFDLALKARHKPCQGLQEESEDGCGQQVGLAEAQ